MSPTEPPLDSQPAALSILCIVSFLNEARHLQTFLDSMAGQVRFPDLLLLVDDGSGDASPAIAAEFAAAHEHVSILRRSPRPATRDRLAEAAELRAFQWGLGEVRMPWDVAVKLDADLKLSPDLFHTLESAFLQRPDLGIGGAYLSAVDPESGALKRERCDPQHVRGATKFYRRSCYEQIAPIEPFLGWDTIDEIAARAHGWQTASLSCPQGDPIHLRPTGSVDGTLRAQYRWGMCAYGIGQHPLWVLLSSGRRLRDRPYLLGSLVFLGGWAMAALRRHERAKPDVRAYGRDEQLAILRRRVQDQVLLRRSPARSDGPRLDMDSGTGDG
jgi:poly-beta-1,6-N-acetyl-D-glucosamine synthase